MKFMEKAKRFFTLKRRANDGFTLVELIVVIAILAILAGVAVPAYSGYINKAKKAGDMQLLGAVNEAFGAACVAENIDPKALSSANISIVDKKIDVDSVQPAAVQEAFALFFQGNENTTFEVVTALAFQPGLGVFADAAEVGKAYLDIFNGITGIDGYKADIMGSEGFTNIGAAGLTSKLDTVTGLAGDLAAVNDNFAASLAGTMTSLAESMGYDLSDETESAAFGEYMQGLINDKAAQLNPEDPDAAYDDARYEILANYAVLNAAQNTAGKTTDEVISDLKGGFSVDDIKAMMSKDEDASVQQEGMANAAMMYAMYTAYANGSECEDKEAAQAAASDISSFVAVMSNTDSNEYKDFQAYLDTTSAQNDAKAYLAAMNVINESASSNSDAVTGLLTNGYNTPELTAALQQLMG